VDDPEFKSFVETLHKDILDLGGDIVTKGVNYYIYPDESLVSKDRHITIMPYEMAGTRDDANKNIDKVLEVTGNANGDGFEVMVTGTASLNKDSNKASEDTLRKAEMTGIPVAFLILLIVFGTVISALIPLLIAGVAILSAIGASSVVGQFYLLSFFVVNMITMMGLAVGIDYSLFVVSRFREEKRKGLSKEAAIAKAGATASNAVLFSGLTVIFALVGLLIVPMNLFQSLALGAIFVVIFAIFATLTLLPAILSLLDGKIDALKIPFIHKKTQEGGRFWEKVSKTVMKHPVISLILTGGLLILLAIPALGFKTGTSGIEAFPEDLPSIKAFKMLDEHFPFGLTSPVLIVIDGDVKSDEVKNGIENLKESLLNDPKSFGTPTYEENSEGDLALLSVPIPHDPASEDAINKIKELRGKYIPDNFHDIDADVYVGGESAGNLDYFDLTDKYRPIVFTLVLAMSFILLNPGISLYRGTAQGNTFKSFIRICHLRNTYPGFC